MWIGPVGVVKGDRWDNWADGGIVGSLVYTVPRGPNSPKGAHTGSLYRPTGANTVPSPLTLVPLVGPVGGESSE